MNRLLWLSLVLLAVGCSTKKECAVGSQHFSDGALDPSNPCQSCQYAKSATAFTPVADGASCGAGKVCGSGACTAGCFIGGAVHAAGVDPTNACQTCVPATSTTAWALAADGATCGAGKVCVADACVDGCFIDGAHQAAGATQPSNACRACLPAVKGTEWSPKPDGTMCGTLQLCYQGTCTGGCIIDGQPQGTGTANPANPCETCQPSLSSSAWTPVADGHGCGTGKVCDHDTCIAGCGIGGEVYTGGLQNPANLCQSCDPARSTTTWSHTAALGASCGPGLVCDAAGACNAGCFIGGAVYPPGGQLSTDLNGCAACDPAVSTTAFSPAHEGRSCEPVGACHAGLCQQLCFVEDGGFYADDAGAPGNPCQVCVGQDGLFENRTNGAACGQGQYCNGGTCQAGCFIGGVIQPGGALNPADACQVCDPDAGTAWSERPEATSCGSGVICHGHACVAGCGPDGGYYTPGQASPANPCLVCDPSAATAALTPLAEGAACGTGEVCNASLTCEAGCFIGGAFHADGAANGADLCQVCRASLSTTAWSAAGDGTACSACDVCSSGVCGPAVLASQSGVAEDIGFSHGSLFWANSTNGTLNEVPTDGGSPGMTVASGMTTPKSISAGPIGIYVGGLGDGTVWKYQFNGTLTAFATGNHAVSDVALVPGGTAVIWADPGAPAASIAGHVRSQLVLNPTGIDDLSTGGSPTSLVVDVTDVYWTDVVDNTLYRLNRGSGAKVAFASTVARPTSLSQDATYVYWTTADSVYQVEKATGTVTLRASGLPGPTGTQSDGTNLYVASFAGGAAGSGSLLRLPAGTGTATTLYDHAPVNHVLVDSQCVYWTEFGNFSGVKRADK